jgi:putative heme-binding domain-containing protein
MSKAELDDGQLVALADVVNRASPFEIERVLAPFARGGSDDAGRALAAALSECHALANVSTERLRTIVKNYGPEIRARIDELCRLQLAGFETQREKIDDLLTLVPGGDFRRGQAVFNGQKGACATCHAFGYLGGNIGPDLTRIGGARTEHDLLESIVSPSASFVRGYEPVTITTKSGKSFTGTLRRDAADVVVLALNAREMATILRAEIDEMVPAGASIMPAGLDQQLTPQELVDLVAFLKGAK